MSRIALLCVLLVGCSPKADTSLAERKQRHAELTDSIRVEEVELVRLEKLVAAKVAEQDGMQKTLVSSLLQKGVGQDEVQKRYESLADIHDTLAAPLKKQAADQRKVVADLRAKLKEMALEPVK